MSNGNKPKPANVDLGCIQEALRVYFQPIKKDDPQLDFYTMYKREIMEYDTEYTDKYNEDLNTTLIFAGLFSAVSSAFVIAVQPGLQPDSGERSEAYLKAILLSLNPSISPNQSPVAPPPWNTPPHEVITTSDLLYASLLMSLLAAFVAMLGKQWLYRYRRHVGGSVLERCGDRQRKFDGLEKWKFSLFIESLPIILQIALFLLTCGLSRHMWSVNTSVAYVIISFTVLGFLFYVVVVALGTYSYDCPYQTPLSTAFQKFHPLPNVISLTGAVQSKLRDLLLSMSLPSAASLLRATWMDARQGLFPTAHHTNGVMQLQPPRPISLPRITASILTAITEFGNKITTLLRRTYGASGDIGWTLVWWFQRFGDPPQINITVEDTTLTPQHHSGLQLHVRNLEALRRQNTDNARCVCWVLRDLTDPEALDSAIRLAGDIRWFDGDSDRGPPFDVIVSAFNVCFDSTKQLYPGMREQAYFSARAILQINVRARVRSQEHALRYPIPTLSSTSVPSTDHDLHHIISMLERNLNNHKPVLYFPEVKNHTRAHLLWTSNLFFDLARVDPDPILEPYQSYLSPAVTNNQTMIVNTLLVWCILLGGHVQEETLWAVDKFYSPQEILSYLSKCAEKVISNGYCPPQFCWLLKFLAAWEERPGWLTPIAYDWCSIIARPRVPMPSRLAPSSHPFPTPNAYGFPNVLPGRGLSWFGRASGRLGDFGKEDVEDLLLTAFQIGFRLVGPNSDYSTLRLGNTPPDCNIFKVAFSSLDDEAIADAACVWIADNINIPSVSFSQSFCQRMGRATPFSPRLRWVCVHAIPSVLLRELGVAGLETVRLLNCLEIDEDDIAGSNTEWAKLLISVIRSRVGPKNLSSHYWCLLDRLLSDPQDYCGLMLRDMEVVEFLEITGEWKKLEVWMAVVWISLLFSGTQAPTPMADVERVTLKLLSQTPSALPRFRYLSEILHHSNQETYDSNWGTLKRICDQAGAG